MRGYGILLLVLLGSSACAGGRIEGGVFRSDEGYRVTLPANGWQVISADQTNLVLKQPEWSAGILLHATCGAAAPRRTLPVLARHLTFGLSDKKILEQSEETVTGLSALRLLLQGRLDGQPVQVEAYVLKEGSCVYDMVYVAPPAEFSKGMADFRSFVSSFASR